MAARACRAFDAALASKLVGAIKPGALLSTLAGRILLEHAQSPLRNGVQWSWHRLNTGWRGPEHELMRFVSTPDLQPTLQRPQ